MTAGTHLPDTSASLKTSPATDPHPLAQVFSRAALKVVGVRPEFRVLLLKTGLQVGPSAATLSEVQSLLRSLGSDDLMLLSSTEQTTDLSVDEDLACALLETDLCLLSDDHSPSTSRYRSFAAYRQVPVLTISPDESALQIAALVELFYQQPALRRALVLQATDISKDELLPFRIEGPFDTSYSLALVNRYMATALAKPQGSVGLRALEATGRFPPHPDFIASHPAVAALQADGADTATTVLRLMYPLGLGQMHGINNGLCAYGWEESVLPVDVVNHINTRLTFTTTMSHYVSRVLADNGVTLPTFTVGLGADHVLETEPAPEELPQLGAGLRFLHISSCFPRKGIDVLLNAWALAFDASDDVTLVIKTFANPHHSIEDTLAEWRNQHPAGARIVLINEDLSAGAVRALYQKCDVLLAPSRGEGFGLPMAEAMLHDMPVVTTGYGGQRDFCTEETAWLLDYAFAPADTHMDQLDSVWVEPDLYQLKVLLQDFALAHSADNWRGFTATRTRNARTLISEQFTWAATAARMRAVINRLDTLPANHEPAKIGFVTTWNSKCGVAAYSQLLLGPAFDDFLILADDNAATISPDGSNVIRCWTSGLPEYPARLFAQIIENNIEQVHFQFNFAFFSPAGFGELLENLHRAGVQTFMTCHSTRGGWQGDKPTSLRSLQPALGGVTRIFVHSVNDLNLLKSQGLVDNVCLFPHGVIRHAATHLPRGLVTDPRWQNLQGKRVIASYGFLLPHKGIPQLIEAFYAIQQEHPDTHLLLMNALYPMAVSEDEAVRCRNLIRRRGLRDSVTLITDFLDDDESLAWLSQAELITFPYQGTSESSSAAIRWGLATGKPVYCTPLDIFNDVSEAVLELPGTAPADIAAGLGEGLSMHGDELEALGEKQQRWLDFHDWRRLSLRLRQILRAAQVERLCSTP